MSDSDLEFSLSFGDVIGRSVLRSPLIMGMFSSADFVVLCVAGVNGGVASGEGGKGVSAGSAGVSNIGLFCFAQGGAGVEGMP